MNQNTKDLNKLSHIGSTKEIGVILVGSGAGFAQLQTLIEKIDQTLSENLVVIDLEKEADKKQIELNRNQKALEFKPYPIEALEPVSYAELPKHKKRNGGNNRKGHKRKKAINGKRKKK